jgi:hypothetical protein
VHQEQGLEQPQVGRQGVRGDPGVGGEAGLDELGGGAGREQGEELRELGEALEPGHVVRVPLHQAGDVVAEPGRAASAGGALEGLRVAAGARPLEVVGAREGAAVVGEAGAGEEEVDEGLDASRELALGQAVELDGLGAAGEGGLGGGQVQQVGGAGDEEAAGSRVVVDGELEGGDQAGGALDLVDGEKSAGVLVDEPVRVGLGGLLGEAVVEGDEDAAALGDDGLGQRRLPHLPCALEHDDPGVVQRLVDPGRDGAVQARRLRRRRGHVREASRGLGGGRGGARGVVVVPLRVARGFAARGSWIRCTVRPCGQAAGHAEGRWRLPAPSPALVASVTRSRGAGRAPDTSLG